MGLKYTLVLLVLSPGFVFAEPAKSVTDGVIQFLEERLRRDPDDFIAAEKLGNTYLQKARESGTIEHYSKAERMFRRVLKWTPDSYPAGASLASTLCSQHRFREALTLARKLIIQKPAESAAYGVIGDAWLEMGDVFNARRAYDKLMEIAPGLSAHARLARVNWLQGRVSAAISNLTAATEFSNCPPESLAWTRVQKGELLFRAGRLEDAEEEYNTALKIFPEYYLALDHIAELSAARGKFDEAATSFQELAMRTGRPEYLQAAADVLTAAKKPAEAKPLYDRALAAYLAASRGSNAHYFHHLAAFYADVREDGAEAEKWARRDLDVRQNVYAWDALAWALFWKRDYAGSIEAMQNALSLGTRDAHLLAHASSIFVRAGRIKEGEEWARRASQANPKWQEFHLHR